MYRERPGMCVKDECAQAKSAARDGRYELGLPFVFFMDVLQELDVALHDSRPGNVPPSPETWCGRAGDACDRHLAGLLADSDSLPLCSERGCAQLRQSSWSPNNLHGFFEFPWTRSIVVRMRSVICGTSAFPMVATEMVSSSGLIVTASSAGSWENSSSTERARHLSSSTVAECECSCDDPILVQSPIKSHGNRVMTKEKTPQGCCGAG